MGINRLFILAGMMLAIMPFSAQADRMNYAYVQLTGLLDTEVETRGAPLFPAFKTEGDGLGIRGGWIMGPYAFADFRYDDSDLDNDSEKHHAAFRVGARTRIKTASPTRLDIYGMLAVEDVEFERTIGTTEVEYIDDNGAGVAVGLRFAPVEVVEFGAEYSYTDLGKHDSSFLSLEGIINVSNWFGLVLEYRDGNYDLDNGDEIDRKDLNLGLRIKFGGDQR